MAEQIWRASKESGVQIIPADLPDLFKHAPNPGESLMRKVMTAVQEFERDVVVARLMHGQQQRLASMEAAMKSGRQDVDLRLTQTGKPKVNGTLSVLERINPSKRQLAALQSARIKVDNKAMSWRPGPASCQVSVCALLASKKSMHRLQ